MIQSDLKTTPYRFQKKAVRQFKKLKGRVLVAEDPGLGKSLQALMYAEQSDSFPAIIVCPAGLKYNWEKEAKIHFNWRVEILESKKATVGRLLTPHKIVVINYDILPYWVDFLIKLKPKLLIGDEAHYISNRKSKRSNAFKKLSNRTKKVLLLTGTPMTNRPANLWNLLNNTRPDLFPKFFPYGLRYCGARRNAFGWEYKGATHLDELHGILDQEVMVRVRKEDVLKDLPAKSRSIVPIEVPNRKEYEYAINNFRSWATRKNLSKLTNDDRKERDALIMELRVLVGKLKIPVVLDWVETFLENSDDKLIVFGIHQAMIRTLAEKFDGLSVVVDGNTKGIHRQKAYEQFNTHKQTRLFIGSEAAITGWSARCSNTLFTEMFWRPADFIQAEDRNHGIGRGKKGIHNTVWYLVGRGTIEENILKMVHSKQKNINAVIDGDNKQVDDFNIMDLLSKQLMGQR